MNKILLLIAILGSFLTSVNAESLDQVGDDVFEKKVLEVIRNNPEFIEKTMIIYGEKKRKEQEAKQFSEIINNRFKVNYGQSPTQGKKDAKYQLVIFTDFECPYCKKGEATVKQLKEKLGDDLFIVQKNYPLGFHKNAKSAALAALAAHQQGKFFEYSEKLFENQRKLSEELYISIAKDLKLDVKKFKNDMKSPEVESLLKEDLKEADKVKVSSTPNFILNGIKVAGAYPLDYFEKIIDIIDLEE